jgi:hypothetical protein
VDDATLTKTVCMILGRVPGWEWRPTGPAYTAAEVGIYYGAIKDTPDRAIGVRVYSIPSDNPDTDRQRGVQLRIRGGRGRPDGADVIASVARPVLAGIVRQYGISEITFTSMAPLGADQNGRQERTENALITLDNPEASS